MAVNHIKVKQHERSNKQIYMEQNRLCAVGGSVKMKFSPQLVESPPPKPPRRRYSEQLSPPYLGHHPPKKFYEETKKGELKSKKCIGKAACLSLPASLTASISNEYDDSYNLQSCGADLYDFNDSSKQKEFYMKYFLENIKLSESFKKKAFHCNRFCDKEKLQSINLDINNDIFLKNQCDSFVPFVDKFCRSFCRNEPLMPTTVINHFQKSVHKNCHRRHSDPVIYNYDRYDPALFYVNFLKESTLKFDAEHSSDSLSYSSKKTNKFFDCKGNCSCCNKTFIKQEIKNLKEINEKLWQHLCSLQNCLENRKKKTHDECSVVSVSDLLSSIYYAQKAKDSAMEERLRIVLEERDAALQEIDDLFHVLTRNCDYSNSEKEFDEGVKDLLGEVSCSENLPRLLKYQQMLLAQITNLKCFKQDSLSLQLRHVTSERNDAVGKVRQLEEDIKNMKICFDLWHSDNKNWEITVFDILNQIIHQRDSILSKIDNGLDIGNVKYRLDSFQQNVSQLEPQSKTADSLKAHQSAHVSDYKQQYYLKTSDEVRKFKSEILFLNKALENEKRKREQFEKRCLRLERLIHILRKKLNGQDIGIHV